MNEYVQYHNPEYASFPQETSGAFSIYTSKSADSLLGSRIWLVARKSETREYYLVYWFIADHVVEGDSEEANTVEGQTGEWMHPPVRIDQLDWFVTFRKYMGNFGLGLHRIADPILSAAICTAAGVATTPVLMNDRQTRQQQRNEPSFSHSDVFPVIAELIVRTPPDHGDYVSHNAIVTAVLADPEAAEIVTKARAMSAWTDDRSAAANMVAWFSQQITIGRSRWSDFFDRERHEDGWAYRPKTSVSPPIAPDIELSAIEGEPRLFFHLRRERDPVIVEAKRQAARSANGELTCEACGFIAQAAYPGLPGDICEVHHRYPLAEVEESIATRLDDLAILCANCHRAIHKTKPLLTVEEFRSQFVTRNHGAG